MAPLKCCVIGCESTSDTHKLFCMPMNDNLRNLWMSLLVPFNPHLLGLTKSQLMTKRVCQKHFDETQFSQGSRIRYSYPCLFTEKEFIHGVPLSSVEYNVLNEHNYCTNQEQDDTAAQVPVVLTGMSGDVHLQEHPYSLTSTSQVAVTSKSKNGADVCAEEHQHPVSPSTGQSSVTAEQSFQRLTSPRKPLMDISHQYNVTDTRQLCEKPISAGTLSVRQFNSKTRRFIKHTKEIAMDSLGQTAVERLQSAHEHASLDIMQNFDNLNKKAKDFLIMQLRLARKNKMARRFTFQDKLFALALMKQSPKRYKLLENIFALPTKRTLARVSQKIMFECGINEKVFDHIKQSARNWDTSKRLCSLVFDEVALTPHLTYNENKDFINGFEEVAEERRQKFADHALVFMARGICSPWRQSIAYYFCAGTVSAPDLENILKDIIPRLSEAGLIPLALVCDQGSTFRACFNNLKAATARRQTPDAYHDAVRVAGHDLFIFHDPPHLLKSIRNNFLDKDIVFEGKTASWKDILYVYDTDMQGGHTRALPRLTADHVDPKRIKKMKVKMAAQVLSARTAAMLQFTDSVHKRLNMPQDTMETTAAVVLFFDELFDSVNGSPGQGKGKLRCAVKENSPHKEFWISAIRKLQNMTFIDHKSKLARRAGQPRHVRVPCLEGWITTLKSFLSLSHVLYKDYKIEYFYPRFVNQDPLENFFGRIRAINYRNVNPDCNTFIYSFKSIVLSNILAPQSNSMNCEDDDGETIIHLNNLFCSETSQDEKENRPISNTLSSSSITNSTPRNVDSATRDAVIAGSTQMQTSAYTAGYICRKITKRVQCDACTKTYTTKEYQGIHEYIKHREYKRLKNKNLNYPNGKILCLYRVCPSSSQLFKRGMS